ncbi:carbon-nitrogen hydrolase family protein [Arcobacteraceae bacterium]|nr:carbon-nitrogen hydrolase family protein [Arcobacteraceae bacterium]
MTSKIELISLRLKTSNNFEKNIRRAIKYIKQTPKNSFILFPELYLTGYSYDKLNEAASITSRVTKLLKHLSTNKTIFITMITKKNNSFYNTLHIFHKEKLIHTQSKVKLFVLNHEEKYFTPGNENDIKIIDIDGIKVATLICFELRFIDLWEKVQGADIILIPAMWGKVRKENFETLTQSLAVINQCYVIASDSSNENMAKSSAIISPFGEVTQNVDLKVISTVYNQKKIKTMRKYLPTGIQ